MLKWQYELIVTLLLRLWFSWLACFKFILDFRQRANLDLSLMITSDILRACRNVWRPIEASLGQCRSNWFDYLRSWCVWYGNWLTSRFYRKYVSWWELCSQLRNVRLVLFLFCLWSLAIVFQVRLETNLSSGRWRFKQLFEIFRVHWRPTYLSNFRLAHLFLLGVLELHR